MNNNRTEGEFPSGRRTIARGTYSSVCMQLPEPVSEGNCQNRFQRAIARTGFGGKGCCTHHLASSLLSDGLACLVCGHSTIGLDAVFQTVQATPPKKRRNTHTTHTHTHAHTHTHTHTQTHTHTHTHTHSTYTHNSPGGGFGSRVFHCTVGGGELFVLCERNRLVDNAH